MSRAVIFLAIAAPLAAFTPEVLKTVDTPRPASELLCGPEIVLIGDAWEHVQMERDALVEISRNGDLLLVPRKLSALRSHLMFIQNHAVMVFGGNRETLAATIGRVGGSVARWNALALAGRREALLAEWPELVESLRTIRAQFPDEAMVSSSEASFVLPPVVPTLQVRLDPAPRLEAGRPAEVRFRLVGPGEVPILPDQLHTTHTEKLHALLLDPLFRDYHHEHPQPTGRPGEYAFHFTPRESGPYRLWLDAMPVATGRGEFPVAELGRIPRPIAKAPAPAAAMTEARAGGYRLRMELPPGGLAFGTPGVIGVNLEEADGSPLRRLEPLMGAFAHVVGFADDFQTILHIHPLGAMPVAGQSGGPRVDFQLRPLLPGWLRLYFQFQVAGETHLAEFAVPVTVR